MAYVTVVSDCLMATQENILNTIHIETDINFFTQLKYISLLPLSTAAFHINNVSKVPISNQKYRILNVKTCPGIHAEAEKIT